MPLFSVIIPTRNRPEFVQDAANSVLRQNCRDLELLIVNDGSSAVAQMDDPRVRVLNSGQRGAVPARNLGIAAASGAYIAFLDDDDVWTNPNHLSLAVAGLNANCDFYFADGMMIYPNGQLRSFAQDADANSLKLNNTILISAVCYKKSLHDHLGNFDEALPYYWDWDWYLRVASTGARLQRGPVNVVDIRVHAQNMSGDSNVAARRANLDMLEKKHSLAHIELKNHQDFT